ncbi:MAG TPA: amino acid adenylation domain-containing protein [Vicinamibacterales bacterium]|nr:amino acid adenylation domain-containing protein [Vicinamibacterales bacterium]
MPTLLQQWVTEQAEARPERSAVVHAGARLSYGDLERLSNQLARTLKAAGCRTGDRVAVLMPKSPMAIASLLAIYKADAIYVPLDPASPPSRLSKILASCDNRWLLAAGIAPSQVRALLAGDARRRRMSLGWLDDLNAADADLRAAFTLADVTSMPGEGLSYEHGAADAAHILFTSGSTGAPKGVIITHGNVIAFVEWGTKYFGMNASDRVSGHPPLHFDLSFFDLFGTFAAGAELHLVPAELGLLPNKLADLIRTSELTQWFSVPSALTYMARFETVRLGDFPALKRVLWCGEVLPTPTLIYWMQRLPHVQFTNLYGPTEATIASSYYTVPACPWDPQAPLPIGTACDGEELLVLDETRRPVAAGETGDLYIAGAGLSPGYWRDRERTEAAFVPRPDRPSERIYKTGDLARIGDGGLVYFLGRADTQIKSRGYRIELGEIEAALNAVDGVQESAVVALSTSGFEGTAICCAYVRAPGARVTPATLRLALREQLPAYMMPARWLAFEELPKNGNGKIDRPRLKEAFATDEVQAS